MFKVFQKWYLRYKENETANKLQHDYEFNIHKKFVIVASLNASTDIIDDYGYIDHTIYHSYVLKENVIGERKVEVTSGASKMYSDTPYTHSLYIKYIAPWKLGVNNPDIPSAIEIMNNIRKPYFN